MTLSLLEQETIILFNRAEKEAEVFTYDPTMKRKLKEIAADFEEVRQTEDNGAGGVTYTLPKNLISVRRPRPKRKLTEKEKAELALRFGNGL